MRSGPLNVHSATKTHCLMKTPFKCPLISNTPVLFSVLFWALPISLLNAAQGDLVATVPLPITGVGVSVATDCEGNIFYTCESDLNLYKISKNGTLLASTPIVDTSGNPLLIDEMAWDNSRKILWAQEHDTSPIRVYRLNPDSGVATFAFEGSTSIGTFRDGIAYDGSDDSLWISGDVSDTIEHFKIDGTFLGSITPKDSFGETLGSISGVAVGFGDQLYLGQDGLAQIVRVRKSDGAFIDVFASPGGRRDEGLECDAISFFPKLIIWSRDFFDSFLAAIEVEPGTCACQVRNTELVGLEVTQAIQDWNDSVPLLSGKPTYVRAHIQSTGPDEIRVTPVLRGFRNGVELPASRLNVLNTSGYVTARPNAADRRGQWAQSANFRLPNDWLEDTIDLRVEAPGLDCKEAADTPNDCSVRVTFKSAPIPNVRLVGVNWRENGQTHAPSLEQIEKAAQEIESTYPISRMNWTWRDNIQPLLFPTKPDSAVEFDRLLLMLWEYKLLDQAGCLFSGRECPEFYLGVLSDFGVEGGVLGMATMCGRVAAGYIEQDNTLAQELAHNLCRRHAPCGSPSQLDANWPSDHLNGRISAALTGDAAIYGLNAFTESIFGPTSPDFMSYCFGTWSSEYTYTNLLSTLEGIYNAPAIPARFIHSALAPTVAIVGSVSVSGTGQITTMYRRTSAGAVTMPPPGQYAISFQGAGGVELATYSFDPEPTSVDEQKVFGLLLPWIDGASRVVLLHGAVELDSRSASPHPPAVTVTYPNGGEALSGTHAIFSWLGNDLDGDNVTYALQYSADGGNSWTTMAADWPQQSIEVDVSLLTASTNALIRVLVNDGFHTAEDTSNGSFSVPNHPPAVSIRSPGKDEIFTGIQAVLLEGSASDAEDGQLAGTSLQWRSTRDGFLGTGALLLLNAAGLSQGAHEISLTATDSSGLVTTGVVNIVVAREPLLRSANLAITKTASADTLPPGSSVTYAITARNNGPDTATNVVVVDTLPPNVSFVSASAGCSETGGVVTCTIPVLNSGGTTSLTITATPLAIGTITNQVTITNDLVDPVPANNASVSTITVTETGEVHDLAIVQLAAPKLINLRAAGPALTKRIKVKIQNRSPHPETIPSFEALANLVTVQLTNLVSGCAAPEIKLIAARPNRAPRTIRPKGSLNIFFEVTFSPDCVPDPLKGPGHQDFSCVARVNHAALDGNADTHPECDVCPRAPVAEPNPDGKIKDKGCGGSMGRGIFGNPVLIDLFLRP